MIVPKERQLFHDDIPTMSGCSVIPKTEKQSARRSDVEKSSYGMRKKGRQA